jgi:biopolymer transport protein ExbD
VKCIILLSAISLLSFCVPLECYPQVLTTVDQRSLKGKVDSGATSPIVVHVEEAGYKIEEESFSRELLVRRLDSWMDTRLPGERVVSVTAEPATQFSRIVELLKIGRELEEDSFSFSGVPVKIVLEEPEGAEPKPGRFFVRVERNKTGSLTLNGKVHSADSLVVALKALFVTRKRQRVFIQGTREVDKAIFVKLPLSSTHQDLVKILKVVQSSGAFPIGIQIDWLRD